MAVEGIGAGIILQGVPTVTPTWLLYMLHDGSHVS